MSDRYAVVPRNEQPGWSFERCTASAAVLHAWQPPAGGRIARWCEVDAPALVVGSAQRETTIDKVACARRSIDVVRRRSGGGAVLTWPAELIWFDVVVPAGDRLWDDDIGRSMWWFGDVWAAALQSCGLDGVDVHRGPLQHSLWSSIVCFEGLGAGEVTIGGRKAVGISQRRTRQWAWMQASVHVRWRGDVVRSLMVDPTGNGPALREPFCLGDELVDPLRRALEQQLSYV